MPFDPNLPANNSPLDAGEMRNQLNALKALLDLQSVPIGMPQPYLKNFPGVPALSANWVECNGQVLSDAQSPLNGQALPDLNGAGGPQRFLRGAATSGGTGGAEAHQHGLNYAVPFAVSSGADAYGATSNADVSDPAASLPSYYEVVWVMRIK